MTESATCASCSAEIANPQMTGIYCEKCHASEVEEGGGGWRSYVNGPAPLGLGAAIIPFGAHLQVNGLDYVKAGAGGIALLAGLATLAIAMKGDAAVRGKKAGIGAVCVALGLLHLLGSGVVG